MNLANPKYLRVGQKYRYGSQENTPKHHESVNGLPNWFWTTSFEGHSSELRFQAGIWSPRRARKGEANQIPFIFCNTSPHKHGSAETPWEDIFAPDEGFAVYFGDNKDPNCIDASKVRGNKLMLDAMRLQHSPKIEDRLLAPPIFLTSSSTGEKTFEGIALINRVEIVMQRLPGQELSFQNLRFELIILKLDAESDVVSMEWVNSRRSDILSAQEQFDLAPASWKEFVQKGISVAPSIRRHIYQSEISKTIDQLPPPGSTLEKLLNDTIGYFDHQKHDFEAVAARVVEQLFERQGLDYKTGWVTQKSGDGGFDFVGRINLDPTGPFPSSKQVILGQAKCERSATNGKDLARLAARLGRGWLGAYVTTSYFTVPVQREVAMDKYPLLLVPGIKVAAAIRDDLMSNRSTLVDYLANLRHRYSTSSTLGLNLAELMIL